MSSDNGGRTTLCFLHGVSLEREAEEVWLAPLEETLASHGFDRPGDRRVEVTSAYYEGFFDSDARTEARPRTVLRLGDEERAAARTSYRTRQARIAAKLAPLRGEAPRTLASWIPGSAEQAVASAISRFGRLEQAHRYSRDDKLRATIIESVVSQLPTSGHLVLVAHSLGSVVALDVIPRLDPAVSVSLVTIGSPLPRSQWGFLKFARADFPLDRMRTWVNVLEAADPVTSRRGVAGDLPEAHDVVVAHGVRFGTAAHASAYYLSLPVVAAAVGDALYTSQESAVETTVAGGIDRTVGSAWHLHLLAGAFAQQVSLTCKATEHPWRRRFDRARRISCDRMIASIDQNLDQVEPDALPIPRRADLMDVGARHLRGALSDEELVPLAIGLLMTSPVQPFDLTISRAHAELSLTAMLDRIRRFHPTRTDPEFARAVAESVKEARSELDAAWRIGPYLLLAGAAVLAATGVGLWAAAPAGVAGAALLTSTLAAFGPGGMVGGMVTIAMASSAGSAMLASGLTAAGGREAGRVARLAADAVARSTTDELKAALVGWMAHLGTQERLGMASDVDLVRSILASVRAEIVEEESLRKELESTDLGDWADKRKLVDKALRWIDKTHAVPFADGVERMLVKGERAVGYDMAPVRRSLGNELLAAPEVPGIES